MVKKFIAGLVVTLLAGCQQTTNEKMPPKQKVEGFYVSTLPTAPVGWQVTEVQGFYCRIFQYSGTGDYVDLFNGAIGALQEQGKKQNANALINLRVTSDSYEIQGSKWHSSAVHICGDFAKIE